MVSNQPIENAAKIAANGGTGPTPAVAVPGSIRLPTTEELLVQAQQEEREQSSQPVEASPMPQSQQPTFTSNSAVFAPMPPLDAARRLDSVALMRAMSDFVKAQNRYIHDKDLARLAAGQEAHIVALTTTLEQLGVL